MPSVAIIGAGEIGGAVAQRLALGARFREIVLIDPNDRAAAGKALDIRQSGAIAGFDTRLSATSDVLAAVGRSAAVVADQIGGGEWAGQTGLDLLRRLVRAGFGGPIVLAGPNQGRLMEAAAAELHLSPERMVGTAPSALVAAARALVALEIDGAASDVQVGVTGRPPSVVVAWSSATIAGSAAVECIAPHRLRAIADAVRRLWPPGPEAIAAATARVAEGLTFGERRRLYALALLNGELGAKGVAAMLALELGNGQVLRRIVPSLSPQERTELVNGLQ